MDLILKRRKEEKDLHKVTMSTKKEHPEKCGWWISELNSLGIKSKRRNDMNDRKELTDLTENIKQALFEEYKIVYAN
jgi:hypothetical protein